VLIDLTLSVDINDPVINKASNDQNSYMSRGHIGTHLDVYVPQPVPPVEYCERRGVLIDASAVSHAEIGVEVLEGHELREGDFLIIYAGWLEKHVYGSRDYFKDHPQFTWDLVNHLATRKLAFIGIDFAGMRRGDEHSPADRIIGEAGAYVIENMKSVDQLLDASKGRGIRMLTGWTGFKGSSGLSCRVVADVQH
jgi:kynurenine formamidase